MTNQSTTSVRPRRDRWADWAVVGVLVLALLLGWAVMALAEGMSESYTSADYSLTLRYPQDWLLREDDAVAFRAIDPGSGAFKTTYEVHVLPAGGATPATTATLAVALNNVSLDRSQGTTAYRQLDVVEGREMDGRATMESTFVYVQKGSDMFVQRLPAVVLGLDVAVAEGDQVYVFSLLAEKDAFEDAAVAFRRFVRSAEAW